VSSTATPEASKLEKNRFIELDVGRVIASLLILYVHSLGEDQVKYAFEFFGTPPNKWLGGIFLDGRVPYFFMIAGFFAAKSLNKPSTNPFYLHKIKSLLLPLLFWNFFSLAIHYAGQFIISSYESPLYSRGTLHLFRLMLGIGVLPANPPTWFIRDLALCFMILPLIWRYRSFYLLPAISLIVTQEFFDYRVEYPKFYSLGFFMIGVFAFEIKVWKYTSILKRPFLLLFLIMLVGLAVTARVIPNPPVLGPVIGALAIFLLASLICRHFPKIAQLMSLAAPAAFLVYCAHMPALAINRELSAALFGTQGAAYLASQLVFPLILFLALCYSYRILSKFKFLKVWALGGR
jgi:hypothetical protein